MGFTFQYLAPQLQSTANAAINWFAREWGIKLRNVKVEEKINPEVEVGPTFNVQTRDLYLLCIEVSRKVYSSYLDAFVVECFQKGLPVKLYVAVSSDDKRHRDYGRDLRLAKLRGVGIIEVGENHGTIIQSALPLSLTGLRQTDAVKFPMKYRQSLNQADQTFRNGSPDKGCALLYDEIENFFRKVAKKSSTKGCWTIPGGWDIEKISWATLIQNWDNNVNRSSLGCPGLNKALCARIHGITTYRNDTGHKPRNLRALIKRDSTLRTRFESAVDLFYELIDAARPLRL